MSMDFCPIRYCIENFGVFFIHKMLPYLSVAAKRQFDYRSCNQAQNLVLLQQSPSFQMRDILLIKHAALTHGITL